MQVSGDRTGMDKESLRRAFFEHLFYSAGTDQKTARLRDHYIALANVVRDRLLQRWKQTEETYIKEKAKTVCYLSAEFLMGRYLGNNMISLGIYETVAEMLAENGINLEDVLEEEVDPGLGNGGLGRLAACFLDSLACLELPAIGYGIRYEFGDRKSVV